MRYIENKTFDEIEVGDTAELTRRLKSEDIELFAVMSGDVNPAHVDEEYAKSDMFHQVIAHGIKCIFCKIQIDLVELIWIAMNLHYLLIKLTIDCNIFWFY